jgi:hypothetical protein
MGGLELQGQVLQSSARRSNAATLSSVAGALKTALANAAVRDAARGEIQRQLKSNRPLAFLSGSWVTAIDMGRIYSLAGVRPALTATLGSNGPTLVNAAIGDPGRFVLAFTPSQLGPLLLGDLARDMTNTVGVTAIKAHMTDNMLIAVAIAFSAGVTVALLISEIAHHHEGGGSAAPPPNTPPYNPSGDTDGDGILNTDDPDDDADGWPDEQDEYPDDKNYHICDCGRPASIYFTSAIRGSVATAVHAAFAQAVSQARGGTSLGSVQAGQTATIRLLIP